MSCGSPHPAPARTPLSSAKPTLPLPTICSRSPISSVPSGSNLQNLNLPIAPNGVVYNSSTRAPIAGATLTMLRAGTPLPASCFDDPAQQGQITLGSAAITVSTSISRIPPVPPAAAISSR